MNQTRRQLICASAAALVATKLIPGAAARSRPPAFGGSYGPFVEIEPREDAGHVVLTGFDGRRRPLSSYRGRSVLLSFWASWCAPCRRELPILQRLQAQSKNEAFVVLPVSLDRAPQAAATFTERLGLRGFTSFIDNRGEVATGPNSTTVTPFALYGLPMSYVIDAQGRSAGYLTGEADWGTPEALALLRFFGEA